MRQRILVDFLQMAVAMITMNSAGGFPHKITQFVNVVCSCGFHFLCFLRLLRLFPLFSFSRLELGPECGMSAVWTFPVREQCDWSLYDRRSFTVLLVIFRGGLFADSLHEGLGARAFRGGGFGGCLF